jgi:hypothetical protein
MKNLCWRKVEELADGVREEKSQCENDEFRVSVDVRRRKDGAKRFK